ncbi:arylsulfatase [candidate division KSB1 bacterium]|nr:arylsulfatase [candidate division KSB1 bacterium]
MKRREFIKLSGGLFTTSLLPLSCRIKSGAEKAPNVILIMTDDQGWGDIHSHENPEIDTPVLDRLAGQGARFERFYVSPVCAPTRASLLTGRYHLRTGTIWVTHGKEIMNSDEVTIAELLKQQGYQTGCFGKWHNGSYYPFNPNGQGFDEFVGFCAGHWNNYFDTLLYKNNKQIRAEGYISDVLTDLALSFIKKNKNNPFFCYIPYNAPHAPFQVPDKYFNKYKNRGFDDANASVYGMVENLDENIGRILQKIDSLGLAGNTIVIFLTDNGPNTERFNGNMKGRKGSVNEGGIRVPLFVRWPGKIKEGLKINRIAAHIDLLPTVLDLCGIDIPQEPRLDGISLVPLLKEDETNWPDRTIYTHQAKGGLLKPAPASARTQQYRLVVQDNGYELYDMIKDPQQKKDISGSYPQIVKKMSADYRSWFEDVTGELHNRPDRTPVGYDEAPTVTLLAPESRQKGNIKFKGKTGWANDWLTGWTDTESIVWWDINIIKSADYEITLFYSCPEQDTGSDIVVTVGGKDLKGTINQAHDPAPFDTYDRVKRTEVYEKVWGELNLGRVRLNQGDTELSVRAVKIPGSRVMDLKAVQMKKMN